MLQGTREELLQKILEAKSTSVFADVMVLTKYNKVVVRFVKDPKEYAASIEWLKSKTSFHTPVGWQEIQEMSKAFKLRFKNRKNPSSSKPEQTSRKTKHYLTALEMLSSGVQPSEWHIDASNKNWCLSFGEKGSFILPLSFVKKQGFLTTKQLSELKKEGEARRIEKLRIQKTLLEARREG